MTATEVLYANGKYNEEEIELFGQAVQYRNIKKDEIICPIGEITRAIYFNSKGAFFQYTETEDGVENIIDLYPEGAWFLNHNSFIAQRPADSSIKAYNDGFVMELRIDSLHWLISKSTSFLQLAKIFEQPRISFFDNKLSPADKYQYVLEHRPALIQLFPLKMIASYLKITPETLSRVREQLSKQKQIS